MKTRYSVVPFTLDDEHPFYDPSGLQSNTLYKIKDNTTGYVSFSAYKRQEVAQAIVDHKNESGGFVV